ncbi:MAG: AAA family ATPase [Bacteroidales bacterium]|nr:AAA family ATPase [Bacteroidales bacterium]
MSEFEEQLMPYWQAYKTYFNNSEIFEDESYKWKALKLVSEKWKWNVSSDFKTIFEEAFKVSGPQNLWSSNHFYPIALYKDLLQAFPDKASETMSLLFDESILLQDRLKAFVLKVEEMRAEMAKLFPDKNLANHFHGDIRAISLYLSLQYPEKYFIYKSGHYIAFLNILNGKQIGSGGQRKYLHFLEIANQVRDFIKSDNDFMVQYRKFTDEPDYYSDTYLNLLVQDFIFFCVVYYKDFINKPSSYWIFQGIPKIYDVVASLSANALKSWTVTAHKDKIKPGDKVILWVTGENAGCYALCKVTSEVENRKDDEVEQQYYTDKSKNESHDRVSLEIEHNFSDLPILKDELLILPEFADFKGGNQGTNYSATKEQYEKILELYWENRLLKSLAVLSDEIKIKHLFYLCNTMVAKYDLMDNDNRVSFSTPKGSITMIAINVGQRYVITLVNDGKPNSPAAFFNLIALQKDKDIFQNQPGFIKFGEFKTKSLNVEPPYFTYFNKYTIPDNETMINAWLEAVGKELDRTEKSSHKDVHNPMFYKAVVNAEYRQYILDKIFKSDNIMYNHPLNQILYGPPGTGKTFNTINEAVKIANPSFDINTSRELLKVEYERLVDEGIIEFITFHQSMSYEDFIEGIKPLKPDPGNDYLKYDILDGLFKLICKKAESNYESSKTENAGKLNFEEAFEKLKDDWEENNSILFPLKTAGYEFKITGFTNSSIQFVKASGGTGHTLSINTLKDYYYKKRQVRYTGVGIYYPGVLEKLMSYSTQISAKTSLQNYVLIIDEINRGNISQIFGELITLIESDKRMGCKEVIKLKLPYSKDEFSVPPNLYIIGTMNTADRSIEALDTALRRRFTFVEMPPKPEIIKLHGKSKGEIDGIDLVQLLSVINTRIEKLIDKDHQIGHSYFLDAFSFDDLKEVFKNKMIPLLEEYFYGDFGKIGLVLGNAFVIEKSKENFKFATFNGLDRDIISDLKERKVYQISSDESWSIDNFKEIYS